MLTRKMKGETKRNTIQYSPFTSTASKVHRIKLLAAYDWFNEVLTWKPQSKQTTTALDQKSPFFSDGEQEMENGE